ncbi:uncharacterized protein BT62DRAFT_991302 [Guyanagaster necrorhizus]|uniref:Uncharacterized protein n=1 Tax=Guyanagaster necrorhizus TaxID=856835 RepID=A0A9P7W0F4_9AGAR|nr:uncharacterized protein BT62DRAFT_991302 [Guyanagaster necrorhizus MCA 3950]KAG7450317.1 hypothetical protein BT62DRAFT_991302 [Guyanagaster necrorhizus MCA 3950]
MAIAVPLPQISISPAPPQEVSEEPFSPFAWVTGPPNSEKDTFRPRHLTPPPVNGHFVRQLSPLRPPEAPVTGKGLERGRFEALLRASRERNTAASAKKTDLRKEVALKAHRNKQFERRALFLSKVLAPPSPTATSLPKTPPESPAIFHYSLPSPGLVSPLALFDSLNHDKSGTGPLTYPREPWIEQVDFRLPSSPKDGPMSSKPPTIAIHEPQPPKSLPSLDQISARLSTQRHASSEGHSTGRATRLPAFLTQPRQSAIAPERPILSVGRLQIPVNNSRPSFTEPKNSLPPASPRSTALEVKTIRVPRTARMSRTQLSESNLLALDSRERRAKDMLSTLRRRTLPTELSLNAQEMDSEERKWRRHSAPADLTPSKPRSGFEHPVLLLPGGF